MKLKCFACAVLMIFFLSQLFEEASAQTTNADLKLLPGFSSTVVADNLGRTRHLIVTPQNDIYVRLARPVNGKGTLMLHEANGKATVVSGFGNYGGTGVYLRGNYLYTASNSEIFRYKLDGENHVIDTSSAERIVTGLVDRGTHNTKSIMMDKEGNMYIPIGCPSNSCQEKDRQNGSPGMKGCPLLETAGGVWMFKNDKPNQTYADGIRYATGLRNVVGVDWNPEANKLFVMQHGRDQLNTIFPDLFTTKDNAELPAECLYALNKGDNAGWPYMYYDPIQKKQIKSPEYGGDGKMPADPGYINPAAFFPAHMAPNGLLFYTGSQFPDRYKNGAFIAFHGSWNRSPEPQAGYFVVFQPFKNGVASGDWEVFADNFSGSPEKTASGRADHRPCGLAIGPNGDLYVSDDVKGTIFKISYKKTGDDAAAKTTNPVVEDKPVTKTSKVAVSSPAAKPAAASKSAPAVKGKTTTKTSTASKTVAAAKPTATPSNVPKATMQAGKSVYMKTCVTCHQPDGGGVQDINPPLKKTDYVLGDKTRLIRVVLNGLSMKEINGEKYNNTMPSFKHLSDKEIADVLTYIRNDFGNRAGIVTPAEVKKLRPKK